LKCVIVFSFFLLDAKSRLLIDELANVTPTTDYDRRTTPPRRMFHHGHRDADR